MKGSTIFSLLAAVTISSSRAGDSGSALSGGLLAVGIYSALTAIHYMIDESKVKSSPVNSKSLLVHGAFVLLL